mgnify:CR=1 FL=1
MGIVAVWYPILTDARHLPMVEALMSAAPDAFRHEVTFGPVREGHRMIGSGMFVVNPPFGLDAEAERLTMIFAAAR